MPLQRGQLICVVSLSAGRNRCRESSSKPNRDKPSELDAGAVHLDRIAQHVLDRALVGGAIPCR